MKRLFASLLLVGLSAPALADPFTTDMTCAQAKALVGQRGSAVLYSNAHVFDRYVASPAFCLSKQITQQAFVRTRDSAACPIGGLCIQPDSVTGDL